MVSPNLENYPLTTREREVLKAARSYKAAIAALTPQENGRPVMITAQAMTFALNDIISFLDSGQGGSGT